MAPPRFIALLQDLGTKDVASITRLGGHIGAHGTVVLPASHEALRLDLIAELRRHSIEPAVLTLTPLETYQRFSLAVLSVAAVYELQRLAIPIHYQNLRDRLQNKYGFSGLSDRQLLAVLEDSELLASPQPSVFRSKQRSKIDWPSETIKRWLFLLKTGVTERVFDVPDVLKALDRWYGALPPITAASMSAAGGLHGWVETASTAGPILYRLDDSGTFSRPLASDGSNFLRYTSISQLIGPHIEPIDDGIVKQMGRAAEVRDRLMHADNDGVRMTALFEYTRLWIDHISKQRTRGQEQKWRGWYLVPEHGALTLEKLRELQRIIQAMKELNVNGIVNIDSSVTGIANVVALLKAGGVKYQKSYTPKQQRNLFVRQQKNYLLRLGLALEPSSNEIMLSALGNQWAGLREADLGDAFGAILRELRWSWCNMPFFAFLERLVLKTESSISYRELYNWVIHVYENSQLDEVAIAIFHYRALPSGLRSKLNERIDSTLRAQLGTHLSESAFGHYRTKVKDLMIAFATTGVFRLARTADAESWRLLRRAS